MIKKVTVIFLEGKFSKKLLKKFFAVQNCKKKFLEPKQELQELLEKFEIKNIPTFLRMLEYCNRRCLKMFMLTKSNFVKFIQCPKWLWLAKFRKDLAAEIDEEAQKRFDEGAEVEEYAYQLFPGGVLARGNGIKEDVAKTKKVFASGAEIIFQPTFSNFDTNLYCRSDILKFDKGRQEWDIYEVKSSTEVKDIYYYDLAFQKICLEGEGKKVGKIFIIHVNNEYVKHGSIVAAEFFNIEDVTEKIREILGETKEKIAEALVILELKNEPEVLILKQCADPYECDYLNYCWKKIPEDSIYDVAGGLSRDQIKTLLDMKIIYLRDIPDGFIKKENYLRHIEAVKSGESKIDKEKIKEELEKLKYPLYFLDYETYSPAVPLFDGYRPYEKITFQYSLDVKNSPDANLCHFEFLSKKHEDPSPKLAESLMKIIGDKGTIVSWNMKFEKECNIEMGKRYPKYKDFFEKINKRMFDLMMIFRNGYVIHKDFKASASLKKVLPVMAPHLSYEKLNIQEGVIASLSWPKLVDENLSKEEREKIYEDMLQYCRLDTLAMAEILKRLMADLEK